MEESTEQLEPAKSAEPAFNRIYIDGERWFTYQQLAIIMHCTPGSIYNRVKTGKIKIKKVDGLSFYRLEGYM